MAKAKIFATIGPASRKQTVLRKMYLAGLDGVRLNFSHGTHQDHVRTIALVRSINRKMKRAIKIMQDLEGYRIRVGRLEAPFEVCKGERFYLTQENIKGNARELPFDYEGSIRSIKTGHLVYIDDGRVVLKVLKHERRRLQVKAMIGGWIYERKGINIPEAKFDFETLTTKDKRDLVVGIRERVDYIAQSFVRTAEDIRELRKNIGSTLPKCRIFAKIECREAVKNLDAILDEADGVIVARGDLGVCVPIYKVPVLQKEIVRKSCMKKKPVMVATQMLDSMTDSPLPTRAEVSDVANAIWEGATHLLLSGETAVGKYPAQTVKMMNNIIKHSEKAKKL